VDYPNKEKTIQRINKWEKQEPIFTDPKLRDSLITFADHYPTLSEKYFNNKISSSGNLFRHSTFLHGDYHAGNMFFDTKPNENMTVYVCDWQAFGIGHPSTEMAYLLGMVEPDPALDLRLMRVYYDELTKKISPEEYPWKVFERECEIRTMGLAVSTFNMFRDTPEKTQNRSKFITARNGLDPHELVTSRLPSLHRFANVVEKWSNENIFQNVDKID